MEEKSQSSKLSPVKTGLLVAVLLLLALGGFYYVSQSQQPGTESTLSNLLVDSSQVNKGQLEDQIEELRSQLTAARQENASLTDQLNGLNDLLSQTYQRLNTLQGARMDRMYPPLPVNNPGADQTQVRDSLANQLALMSGKVEQLRDVTRQNTELQRSLSQRDAKLQTMVPASAVTGDEFRISLRKSNEKVTAKAKKVNTLTLSFTVPAERRLEGAKEVYLSLAHESGKSSQKSLTTVTLPSGTRTIPVDARQTITFNGTSQPVTFSFQPTVPLKPGRYQASIYTSDAYLGSVAVELRDSFWFF